MTEYSTIPFRVQADFSAAEQAAFRKVGSYLKTLGTGDLAVLHEAAARLLTESLQAHGFTPRPAWVQKKASRWSAWWSARFARCPPRPHTQYTPEQAARGRQVSLQRRSAKADMRACRAQWAAEQGYSTEEIAASLGLSKQHTRHLFKRRVCPLFAQFYCQIFMGRFGKSSCVGRGGEGCTYKKPPHTHPARASLGPSTRGPLALEPRTRSCSSLDSSTRVPPALEPRTGPGSSLAPSTEVPYPRRE